MNAGARALKALGLTQSAVAEVIGTDQSVVCRWETSERKPSPEHRAKLEDKYDIGWRLWDEETAEDNEPESEPKPKTVPKVTAAESKAS